MYQQIIRIAALVFALFVLNSAPASAKKPAPVAEIESPDLSLAKVRFKTGEKKYEAEDYAGALKEFEGAKFLQPKRIELDYNIARCHDRLGNWEQAVKFYTAYADTKPKDEKEVRERIAILKERLAAKPLTTPAVAGTQPAPPALAPAPATRTDGGVTPAAPATPYAGSKPNLNLPAPAPAPPAATVPLVPTTQPVAPTSTSPPFYKKWWFWTAVGAAALVAVGVGIGVGASRETTYSQTRPDLGTVHFNLNLFPTPDTGGR